MGRYLYGLDLALGCSGVAVYDLDAQEFVHIGTIDTKTIKKKKGLYHNALKLMHIHQEFAELKKRFPPEAIVIERGFSQFAASTQAIFRVHGVVNLLFWDKDQQYYPPKTIKEALFSGTASKAVVREAITFTFPDLKDRITNEDESDAVAVVLTHLIKQEWIDYHKPKKSQLAGS